METMAGERDAQTLEEGNETLDVKGGTAPVNMSSKVQACKHQFAAQHFPRELMEVFSVKLPGFEKHHARDQMYGYILISADLAYVVLDRFKLGTPLDIDDEGSLRLRGPNRVIDACDFVRCIAYLFKYHEGAYQFKRDAGNYRYSVEQVLWNGHTKLRNYNTLLTESVYSHFGPIVLNYAVYDDSAEASVDVRVVPCQASAPAPAAVFGTVTAYNSCLGEEGKSVLFKRSRDDAISLDVASDSDKYACLPLSRRRTVQPKGSIVTICLDIKLLGKPGDEDQSIISTALHFRAHESWMRRQHKSENGVWRVKVVVTWHDEKEEEDKLFWDGPLVV